MWAYSCGCHLKGVRAWTLSAFLKSTTWERLGAERSMGWSPPHSPSQRWIRGSNAGQVAFYVHMLAWGAGGCPSLVDGSFPFPFPRLVPLGCSFQGFVPRY